jgi:hypothetical protein
MYACRSSRIRIGSADELRDSTDHRESSTVPYVRCVVAVEESYGTSS